jgi:DNA polymerase III epsilon subunit-like protein
MSEEEFRKPSKITSANKTFWGMNHLNGNLLCAVDVETTGTDPNIHGIVEIAILPLNGNLEPHEHFPLFHMRMKPEEGEEIDEEAFKINQTDLADLILTGFPRETVADFLMNWFETLGLIKYKKIMALGCNWPFDRAMLERWVGKESFEHVFDVRYRDVQVAANFLNDCADVRCEQVPFSKVNLKYLCSTLKVENPRAHSAIGDCLATAQIYRKLLNMRPGLL